MTPNPTPATRASVPPPKRNGNEPVDTTPLPEHRQKLWEAGNAAYQTVLAERDDLERKLHQANLKIEEMAVQLNSLNTLTNMLESGFKSKELELENRVRDYQSQRDEAVSRFASLEATLANIYVICRNTINEPPQGEPDGQ
jgi:chromosome segregation ATPase